jgi:hypothetical protein
LSTPKQPTLADALAERYRTLVGAAYPDVRDWPILSGYNYRQGAFGAAAIVHLQHTGFFGTKFASRIDGLTAGQVGVQEINTANRGAVIARLEILLSVAPRDMLIVAENAVLPDGTTSIPWAILEPQLKDALARHEAALGLIPMKIFLSHKGADKPKIREYKKTLLLLGFDPWLDEDAMLAGANLERGLLAGFKESCAAVFFVTPRFVDENYLGSEVEYAIHEKRSKGTSFQIVTLVFSEGERKGEVPALLRPYVWKEPCSDLEGLQEILKSLPLSVGPVRSR